MPPNPTIETVPPETLPATIGSIGSVEISANLRRHAEAARGAFASNTERALKGDIARFTGWCRQDGRHAMPASPETVALPSSTPWPQARRQRRCGDMSPRSPPSIAPLEWQTRATVRTSSWR